MQSTLEREKELFNKTALHCSEVVTKSYSTSFSLGIRVLAKRFRSPVYAIYGFVRYADEIVDTFHHLDREKLLNKFRDETYEAIDTQISFNPVLQAFQLVVNQYKIEKELIEAFFISMKMDLSDIDYDSESYEKYIYGSAEVVGLMCMRVFCENNTILYDSLVIQAKSLGAAFQKVNFLRDMKSDFHDRGRVYFPDVDFKNFSSSERNAIEGDIISDFEHALDGIKKLPTGAKIGVYLAYVYYLKLFKKIQNTPTQTILTKRVRIPDYNKAVILIRTYLKLRVFQTI